MITGIGDERASTILDEVAHRRFDTPSKVALHVETTVKDSALAALVAHEQITLQVARILTRERTALQTQVDRIGLSVHSTLGRADDDGRKFLKVSPTAVHYRLPEAEQSLAAGQVRLVDAADQALWRAEHQADRAIEAIAHRSEVVGERRAKMERAIRDCAEITFTIWPCVSG